MAKPKGNPASVEGGFFVTGGGRKPRTTQKHTMKNTTKRKPAVKAEPRVGVYKG